MKVNPKKIESVVTELIDFIEQYFSAAPARFVWIDAENESFAYYDKERVNQYRRFEPWFQHLLETLDPFYLIDEQQQDKESTYDSASTIAFSVKRVSFYVGLLVGAKNQGATRQELIELSRAMVEQSLSFWQMWRENTRKQKAKKEGHHA